MRNFTVMREQVSCVEAETEAQAIALANEIPASGWATMDVVVIPPRNAEVDAKLKAQP